MAANGNPFFKGSVLKVKYVLMAQILRYVLATFHNSLRIHVIIRLDFAISDKILQNTWQKHMWFNDPLNQGPNLKHVWIVTAYRLINKYFICH